MCSCFFFSSRRRHTRCALVTGVQTCALPICTVAQLLQTKPNRMINIAPDDTVLEAVRRMADAQVGALMEIRDGQLVGIISERDYEIGRASCRERVCQYV